MRRPELVRLGVFSRRPFYKRNFIALTLLSKYEGRWLRAHCVNYEIDVLRKESLNVLKLVNYIRFGKWPKDENIYDRIYFVA